MRRTKIVATLGPACRDLETLKRMVEWGLDVGRLNFSHGTPDEHAEAAGRLREAAGAVGRQVALLQDIPGPKLRIGPVAGGTVELPAGGRLTLACGERHEGDAERLWVSWRGLPDAVEPDSIVYLADGAIRLRVAEVDRGAGEVRCTIEIGGVVASRQGINIPGETSGLPAVTEEDYERIAFGEGIGVDMIALSYVRTPGEIEAVREHTRLPLIAKIERPQAAQAAEEIVKAADCVMVARGDLGIELPIEEVPHVQKRILALAGRYARPSITATQMLDSMVRSTRPTRAEVADVANAILDGTDAVMLSEETAVGRHPVDAVAMMAAIAERTDAALPNDDWIERRVARDGRDPSYTIAYDACASAKQLKLAALVVPTLSGRSARLVSAHRPDAPILVLSPGKETVRRCTLMWGVQTAHMKHFKVTEELIDNCVKRAVELGVARAGDRIGITAGLPTGKRGSTNLFHVRQVPADAGGSAAQPR